MIWGILSLQVDLKLQINSYAELNFKSSENFESTTVDSPLTGAHGDR